MQDQVRRLAQTWAAWRRPNHRHPASLVHTASIYETMEATEGWKDFMQQLDSFKLTLTNDLIQGKFYTGRRYGTTDDDLRAMLYIINRIQAIPVEVRFKYQHWRQATTNAEVQAEARFAT